MKTMQFRRTGSLNVLGGGLALLVLALAGGGDLRAATACERTADNALRACRYQARADYWLGRGKCENVSDRGEREACVEAAEEELDEALDECEEQFEARRDLCDALDEGRYDPPIDPADFVSEIDNPFLPLTPGTTRIYEKETDEGLERTEVEVTDGTKTILGVVCTAVRDTVRLDGVLVEDTVDWFAQDREGNVWYFGEISLEYEDGELAGVEGSWQAGVDGAHPGIVMPADPRVGDFFRQEFLLGEAEDAARVAALEKTITVPQGTFEGCLKTVDFSPLEPDARESKYYAPGVGLILEVSHDDRVRNQLVEIQD